MHPVRIEMLGRACMAIRSGRHELVTDPWFSGPAHLGAFRAYPELDQAAIERMRTRVDQATHVYVSQDHDDHFDPAFLRSLSAKVVLVPDLHSARFRERCAQLAAYGHSVRVLHAGEALELDGRASVRIVTTQPRYRGSSVLVVHTPFGSIVDMNDCELEPELLASIAERARVRVFAASLDFIAQRAGFAPPPQSAEPGVRAQLDARRERKVESFRAALRALQPDLGLVIAGPGTYADAVNSQLNQHPDALDWSALVARLDAESCVLWPAPSSLFELGDEGVAPLELLDFDSLLRSGPAPSAALAATPENAPSSAEIDRAAEAFVARIGALLDLAGVRGIPPLYLSAVRDLDALDKSEHAFCMRIELERETRGAHSVAPVMPEPPFLQITSTPAILRAFLLGELALDDLALSARARFSHSTGALGAILHDALRVAHDADATAALIESLDKATTTFIAGERHKSG